MAGRQTFARALVGQRPLSGGRHPIRSAFFMTEGLPGAGAVAVGPVFEAVGLTKLSTTTGAGLARLGFSDHGRRLRGVHRSQRLWKDHPAPDFGRSTGLPRGLCAIAAAQ
jgi:hypothetical protein